MDICERQVRERAYYIWEGEGYEDGRAETHWLRAESELREAADAAQTEAVAAPAAKTAAKAAAKPRTSRAKSGSKPEAGAKPASKPRSKSVRSPASPELSPF